MQNINKYIDHTILKADACKQDVKKLCKEAMEYDFFSVCINSSYVSYAKTLLVGSDVKVCSVVGFPLGTMSTKAKIFEAKQAVEDGADEIDMVINVGKLKDEEYKYLEQEISQIKLVIGKKVLKVILETSLLTDSQISKASEISVAAKADFVKTSTGFSTRGASENDVILMKAAVKGNAQIKASGGVRDLETAVKYIKMGVSRLGTSSGISIMNNQKSDDKY
ncbi:MAG: deoxyribose-phosphate aldolase [Flavobacteriaceae bacterium]|nr:deoxyribose-phosphate aldolase [Flavobacteriaceae bacterium]